MKNHTKLGNLLLLCHFHHRLVHEQGWKAALNRADGTALFFDPRGELRGAHRPAPSAARRRGVAVRDRGAPTLARDRSSLGVHPDGWALASKYGHYGYVPFELIERARDALDRARRN